MRCQHEVVQNLDDGRLHRKTAKAHKQKIVVGAGGGIEGDGKFLSRNGLGHENSAKGARARRWMRGDCSGWKWSGTRTVKVLISSRGSLRDQFVGREPGPDGGEEVADEYKGGGKREGKLKDLGSRKSITPGELGMSRRKTNGRVGSSASYSPGKKRHYGDRAQQSRRRSSVGLLGITFAVPNSDCQRCTDARFIGRGSMPDSGDVRADRDFE
jgi:hypothetical protein